MDVQVKAMRTEFNRMAAAERRRFKDTVGASSSSG